MIIRRYKPEDAAAIDEIYDRCHANTFGRPNLDHTVAAAVIEKNDKIVAFGCLEIILEAVMIIDMDLSVIERFEILKQLLDVAEFATKDKSFERFYIFPSDENFKEILVNRFRMNTCSPILSCEIND